ncbi:MAG: 50S ribosomal protein L31 [Elusimicrobia bacterium]|nr:50S ribosomal protein L31 [Elusimicrobiota bacterium]
MREGIHPRYVLCNVTCACGNSFVTRSVKPALKLDICSACHPLFTGKEKLIDTAGRVERFNKRFAKTEGKMAAKKHKASKEARAHALKKKLSTAPIKAKPKAKKAEPIAKEKADKKP